MKAALVPLPDPHSTEDYIAVGVAGAIAIGIEAGQTVAHPDDPITHRLIAIDGPIAVCEHGLTGEEVRFPAVECFDPNRARQISISSKFRSMTG